MTEEVRDKGKSVRIVFHVPENIVARYATNVVVQHTEHEFIVSFFELERPPLLGSPEQIAEQLKQLDEVRAKCVARIIVAPRRMEGFVKAMQENLSKYLADKGAS